jgi:transcriptional regulator with XRE-family HTH domain
MRGKTMTPREAREAQGLTIQELAQKSGLSYSLVQAIETGRIKPSFLNAQKIGDALRLPVRLIFPELWRPIKEAYESMRGK